MFFSGWFSTVVDKLLIHSLSIHFWGGGEITMTKHSRNKSKLLYPSLMCQHFKVIYLSSVDPRKGKACILPSGEGWSIPWIFPVKPIGSLGIIWYPAPSEGFGLLNNFSGVAVGSPQGHIASDCGFFFKQLMPTLLNLVPSYFYETCSQIG